MIRLSSIVGLAVASAVGGQAMATAILVFDENSQHGLAWTAAQNLAGGGAVLSGMADFDTQLAAGGWDVVAVDCPSNIPAAGWGALEAYVNGGGRVVMTYWDWDGSYVPHNLVSAFGATATTGDVSWGAGISLTDMGTSSIFAGVTMPNDDWHNHWGDDGDSFALASGSVGLGQINGAGNPVIFAGNNGRTIASAVMDEAGDIWLGDGSGVQLWENMMSYVVPGPGALAFLGLAGLAGARRRR